MDVLTLCLKFEIFTYSLLGYTKTEIQHLKILEKNTAYAHTEQTKEVWSSLETSNAIIDTICWD